MKITVIGSHLCPDTLYALCRLREKNAEMDFRNLSASLPDLKAYLAVRESCYMTRSARQAESESRSLRWRTAPGQGIWMRFWLNYDPWEPRHDLSGKIIGMWKGCPGQCWIFRHAPGFAFLKCAGRGHFPCQWSAVCWE